MHKSMVGFSILLDRTGHLSSPMMKAKMYTPMLATARKNLSAMNADMLGAKAVARLKMNWNPRHMNMVFLRPILWGREMEEVMRKWRKVQSIALNFVDNIRLSTV